MYCMKLTDVRLNVITGDIDVTGELFKDYPPTLRLEELTSRIMSDRHRFKGCTTELASRFLRSIALARRYNPVLEAIQACEWDGRDRVAEVYSILNLPDDDDLSRVLVLKWFYQTVLLLENPDDAPYGADGMLVLCGCQGVGKTSLLRTLAMRTEWFGEGCHIDPNDKDTIIQITKCWIAELGEIESTVTAKNINNIKAFVTNSTDRYRRPYASKADDNTRHTSLCATCNTTDFLVDQTGNRRFWTVPVEKIDLDALSRLDALQLWAQVYGECHGKPNSFRLTPSERTQLEERNGKHLEMMKGEAEVRDILMRGEERPETKAWVTVTEFVESHPGLSRKYSSATIGKVLTKLGIPEERDKHGRRRYLPILNPAALTEKW